MSIVSDSRNTRFNYNLLFILLLVVFLVLAVILPRIFSFNPRGFKKPIVGVVKYSYSWLDNHTLLINVTNRYDKEICVSKIVLANYTLTYNNTCIPSNSTYTIVLSNIYLEKRIVYAKIYYLVNDKTYYRLLIITR
ncbi:MAG: hypothetical protein B6U89_06510 [Desulfurococcales archaeon ex4484_58]|nr:MAG: hypothetical protein B6U89_06510 [Desulfurococcales archaeon ex4484_58]